MSRRWLSSVLLPLGLAVGVHGCAYNATGAPAPRTIVFEFSIPSGAQFIQSPNVAYYVVLNDTQDPTQGPLVNGPVPESRPNPNPLSYLPFVRDDRPEYLTDKTDNTPTPHSYWSTYFAMYQVAGQEVMYQGQLQADGTVNETFHQLQGGREWGINGSTVQITLPMTTFLGRDIDDSSALPTVIPMNLAVGLRGQAQWWYQLLVNRWGQVQNTFFTIPTATGDQTFYNTNTPVLYPQNLPAGTDQNSVNIVSYHYRITLPQ